MTATEIAEYEQMKEMYRKMGINIESEWARQAWEALKPVRKALMMQEALKTETVFFVMENNGYLKLYPLKQGELNIFCKEMLCENVDTE